MDFSFPEYFTISGNQLMNFRNGSFTSIDINNPIDNFISIDGIDYIFSPLSENGNKGGNSIILKLYEAQGFDMEDVEYGIPDRILKISKNYLRSNPNKGNIRFTKEIQALLNCKAHDHQNVIAMYEHGECHIYSKDKRRYYTHQCYTMEYAAYDLKSYIEEKHSSLSIEEKLSLCISISEGLSELRKLGYYHRDLKPDNIFITDNNIWKIGDLGLIEERDSNTIDDIAEFIGPKGWMTPEAMNKFLSEGKGFSFPHNCTIDHQSDIFQLGKVFWYIFQHNAPIGTVKESDFLVKNSGIFSIIKTMLNHNKKKRYKDIDDILKLLKPLETKILKSATR